MFTQSLPVEVFQTQREFIRVFHAPLDFTWWAKKLIVEETGELLEAHANEPMANILKEIGDVVYVVAGFYNTMPLTAQELRSDEQNQELNTIFEDACEAVSTVTNERQIPIDIVIQAFMLVHQSNMSKCVVAEDGTLTVERREDGKILKGPNYQKPDMTPLVAKYETFIEERKANEESN